MNENAIRNQIQTALNLYCDKCDVQDDPYLAQHILHLVHASGEKGGVYMKKKVSIGLVLLFVLILMCMTALAAGIVMSVMTNRVAEMDANGQFITWGLEEKYAFVLAMRESGYDMNEDDWAILSEKALPETEREAAADRIVYDRYGAVQEEANAMRPMPKDSVMGEAPDAIAVFRERFTAENPDSTYYDYLDALGYWLRDEYEPLYRTAQQVTMENKNEDAITNDVGLTREMVEESFVGYLTEVFNWPASVVEHAEIICKQDPESKAWHARTEIDAAMLMDALGSLRDDATFEHDMITIHENRFHVSYWVTRIENGDWQYAADLETLLAGAEEANRVNALHTIYIEDAQQLALRAVAEQYGLSDKEINRYFLYDGDTYWNDPNCVRVAVLFRTRNNSGAPWDYAAIVNMTTAQVDDAFAASDLPAKAAHLAENWEMLQENDEWLNYYRFFSTWNPYGWYTDAPEDEWRAICEVFQDLVRKQQAEVAPGAYYSLQIFEMK